MRNRILSDLLGGFTGIFISQVMKHLKEGIDGLACQSTPQLMVCQQSTPDFSIPLFLLGVLAAEAVTYIANNIECVTRAQPNRFFNAPLTRNEGKEEIDEDENEFENKMKY